MPGEHPFSFQVYLLGGRCTVLDGLPMRGTTSHYSVSPGNTMCPDERGHQRRVCIRGSGSESRQGRAGQDRTR